MRAAASRPTRPRAPVPARMLEGDEEGWSSAYLQVVKTPGLRPVPGRTASLPSNLQRIAPQHGNCCSTRTGTLDGRKQGRTSHAGHLRRPAPSAHGLPAQVDGAPGSGRRIRRGLKRTCERSWRRWQSERAPGQDDRLEAFKNWPGAWAGCNARPLTSPGAQTVPTRPRGLACSEGHPHQSFHHACGR